MHSHILKTNGRKLIVYFLFFWDPFNRSTILDQICLEIVISRSFEVPRMSYLDYGLPNTALKYFHHFQMKFIMTGVKLNNILNN